MQLPRTQSQLMGLLFPQELPFLMEAMSISRAIRGIEASTSSPSTTSHRDSGLVSRSCPGQHSATMFPPCA